MKKGITIVAITLIVLLGGLIKIKADTITGNDLITYYKDSGHKKELPYPSGTSGVQYYELVSTYNNIETDLIYLSRTISRNSVNGHITKYIRIPFMITGKLGAGYEGDFQESTAICHERYMATPSEDYDNAFNYHTTNIYDCDTYRTGNVNTVENVNVQLSISLYSTNGEQTPCLKDNDSYKCELKEGLTYNSIYLKYSQSTQVSYTTGKIRLNFNRYIMFYEDDTTQVINNQNQNTKDIKDTINQNTTYEDKSEQYTNETQEMDEYKNKEKQLLNEMNFTALDNLDITINPETNNFIWNIVEGLRTISGKIVLLMTSVLGLGIIKMILNR